MPGLRNEVLLGSWEKRNKFGELFLLNGIIEFSNKSDQGTAMQCTILLFLANSSWHSDEVPMVIKLPIRISKGATEDQITAQAEKLIKKEGYAPVTKQIYR